MAKPISRRGAEVRWAEPRYSDQKIMAYEVEVVTSRNDGNTDRIITEGTPPETRVRFSELASQAVRFRVRAVSASGQSSWSVSSSVTNVQLRADADRIYGLPIDDFATAKKEGVPARLDFSDNDCSGWLLTHGTVRSKFRLPCERHDFGYRNFGTGGLDRTLDRKKDIDARLYTDAVETCNPSWELVTLVANQVPVPCNKAAENFYLGVVSSSSANDAFFGKNECSDFYLGSDGRPYLVAVSPRPLSRSEAAEILECNKAYFDGTGLDGERKYDDFERRLARWREV